ncbi:hypothetical protein [Guptibacillus algicola]|uniref:hypothetical protein n=1 Tax=Guptibacillus algicola TaxID=225844 RepID=UPI001CD31F4C|nr:hypothetical protein [Alkalihalobacillus algicola]MCA0987699.1 hypothetical protein [Alkalihalobacillus algicola]
MGTLELETGPAKSEALFLKRLQHKFEDEQHNQQLEHLTTSQPDVQTKHIRETCWNIKPVRADLQDQRVCLTPRNHSDIKRYLEIETNVVSIDFSDHLTTSEVHSSLEIINHFIKTAASLNKKVPAIMIQVGSISSQTLMVVGTYLFRNANYLLSMRSAPYLILKGIDSYRTARVWKNMISFAEGELSLVNGTVKAAVVIDESNWTECDDILYELRNHSAGLRISTEDHDYASEIVQSVISVGHRRGSHVLCIRNAENISEVDVQPEAITGFDGMSIREVSAIEKVTSVWNLVMPESNQIWKKRINRLG